MIRNRTAAAGNAVGISAINVLPAVGVQRDAQAGAEVVQPVLRHRALFVVPVCVSIDPLDHNDAA
jgi:hypothetical protein